MEIWERNRTFWKKATFSICLKLERQNASEESSFDLWKWIFNLDPRHIRMKWPFEFWQRGYKIFVYLFSKVENKKILRGIQNLNFQFTISQTFDWWIYKMFFTPRILVIFANIRKRIKNMSKTRNPKLLGGFMYWPLIFQFRSQTLVPS